MLVTSVVLVTNFFKSLQIFGQTQSYCLVHFINKKHFRMMDQIWMIISITIAVDWCCCQMCLQSISPGDNMKLVCY